MKIQRLTTLALSLSALFGAAAVAQARPDVVNIAAPNGANISHNYYNRLNINQNGLVLNNSTTAGVSELAGALGANPKFRGRAADTILMEVRVPGQASHLGGALESFGKRADVIIANPNGITVNGMSTINVRSLTLMDAATPRRHNLNFQFRNDARDSNGITIEGAGINATGLNFFDLLSNRIRINGPISVGNNTELNVRSGVESYRYNPGSTGGVEDADLKNAAASDELHISASAAGAMHGSYITIKTGSGDIDLNNSIRSSQSLTISADGNISVKDFSAGKAAGVKGANVTFNGQGTATHISSAASMRQGKITAQRDALLTATSGDLSFRAKEVELHGALRAEQSWIEVTGGMLSTRSGVYKAKDFRASVDNARLMGGTIDTRKASVNAVDSITLGSSFSTTVQDALFLDAGKKLDNKSRRIRAGNLIAIAQDVSNAGVLESLKGKVDLQAYSLENRRGGEIRGEEGIRITSYDGDENASIVNEGKILSGRNAKSGKDAIFIRTEGRFVNAPRALVQAEVNRGNVNIQAADGVDLEYDSKIRGDHITFTAAKLRTEDGEAKAAEIIYDAKTNSYIVDGRVYKKTRSRFDNEERYMDYGGRLYTEQELMDQVAKDNLDLRDYLGTGYGGGYHGGSNVDIKTDADSLKTAFGK